MRVFKQSYDRLNPYKITTKYFLSGTISNVPAWFTKLRENGNATVTVVCFYTNNFYEAKASLILSTAEYIPMPSPNPHAQFTVYKVARFK